MGSMSASKAFSPGIHVPSLTWFKNEGTQEIDWDVQTKHIEFLVNSGLHGGETVHSETPIVAPLLIVENSGHCRHKWRVCDVDQRGEGEAREDST